MGLDHWGLVLGALVSPAVDGRQPDFQLQTEHRRFEIDRARDQATIEISTRLTGKDCRFIAAKLLQASSASDGDIAASALSAALGAAAGDIVAWTGQTAK